ncbi:uncharacterized protein LOC126905189 [Daktulosphaira vitifoliae]|uniref:uncharacterized protein LOC126905189 n=1 Tax=Daktulosphaira vitifoliae TaxID=58002 RepID=UPI0021AA3EDC|nr:uncharacterized protein LOC126905189 [Daktulosphaira vitifoliae]XP_050540636.1 uncharacterized protein LOC126905189 [Daktulosphaira vitifoliae]
MYGMKSQEIQLIDNSMEYIEINNSIISSIAEPLTEFKHHMSKNEKNYLYSVSLQRILKYLFPTKKFPDDFNITTEVPDEFWIPFDSVVSKAMKISNLFPPSRNLEQEQFADAITLIRHKVRDELEYLGNEDECFEKYYFDLIK